MTATFIIAGYEHRSSIVVPPPAQSALAGAGNAREQTRRPCEPTGHARKPTGRGFLAPRAARSARRGACSRARAAPARWPDPLRRGRRGCVFRGRRYRACAALWPSATRAAGRREPDPDGGARDICGARSATAGGGVVEQRAYPMMHHPMAAYPVARRSLGRRAVLLARGRRAAPDRGGHGWRRPVAGGWRGTAAAAARSRGGVRCAVGLATQSWGAWAQDLLKGGALGLALNAGAAPVAVALMRRFPRGWWLPAGGVAVAGAGVADVPRRRSSWIRSSTASRRWPRGRRAATCWSWRTRAGVSVGEVYEVDASRRTSAANAYVSGLGATKRVVLFDTLLRELHARGDASGGGPRARPRTSPRRAARCSRISR